MPVRGGDGRVKPGHDALGQTPTYVTLSGGWYYLASGANLGLLAGAAARSSGAAELGESHSAFAGAGAGLVREADYALDIIPVSDGTPLMRAFGMAHDAHPS